MQQNSHEPNQGNLQIRSITNAVAGVEISLTIPNSIRSHIYSAFVRWDKTTGASSVTIFLDIFIGATRIYNIPGVTFFSGVFVNTWQWCIGTHEGAVLNSPTIPSLMAHQLILPPGAVINTNTLGLNAADTLEEFSYYGQEWISK